MHILKWLESYASALIEPAHGCAVLSNARDFVDSKNLAKRVWLRAKRDLVLFFTLQLSLAKKQIPTDAKRILYVYLGTPNLGDSIMDLSPRVLWTEQGLKVDLYTSTVIASLYEGDPSFHRIISCPKDFSDDYDFIVLQSYSWKCLKLKWRYYFLKPFVSLHGHYYGCEFNRLEFSEAAWRSVMCLPRAGISRACPPIFNLGMDHSLGGYSTRYKNKIALAVGGVVNWRTYPHWPAVVTLVQQHYPALDWVLIGSENGVAVAEEIMKSQDLHIKITNLVCKVSLNDVFRMLQKVGLLVAADGGLMNVGRAAQVPIIALFAREIHPRMRFDENDLAHVIHSPNSVEDINPDLVAKAIIQSINQMPQMLTADYLGASPMYSKYKDFL